MTVVCGVVGFCGAALANPFEKGLVGTDPSAYLRNADVIEDDAALVPAPDREDGTTALRLRFDKEVFAEFRSTKVEPGKAYTFSFDGRWANEQTLETNYMYVIALRESWEPALEAIPTAHVDFFDDHNKVIEARLLGSMPYGQWKSYDYSFFAPAGTVRMQLRMKSGMNPGEFFVANPKLIAQEAGSDAVVLSFRPRGKDDAGRAFGVLRDGEWRQGDGGQLLLATGQSSRTEFLPLNQSGKYRLTIKGQAPVPQASKVVVTMFAADRKRLAETSGEQPITKPLEFETPEGATSAMLQLQGLWLDEIRVERVK